VAEGAVVGVVEGGPAVAGTLTTRTVGNAVGDTVSVEAAPQAASAIPTVTQSPIHLSMGR
jgi:hypothetical protein